MSLFLLTITEQYLAEKRFVKETEIIRIQEYYMYCSLLKVETILQEGGLPVGGIFQYDKGKVTYQVQKMTNNLEKVSFSLIINNGEEAIGIGYYDNQKGRMVKWIEKN